MSDEATMTPNLANLVGQALDEGSHYIAFRDTEETDLVREIARLVAKRHRRDRMMVVTESLEQMTELAGCVRAFDRDCMVSRISTAGRGVEIGTMKHALRRVRYPARAYSLLVLLPGLEHAAKARLVEALPQAAVLDADPYAGQPVRPADRVLYRPLGSALQTLQTTTPLTSRYRH